MDAGRIGTRAVAMTLAAALALGTAAPAAQAGHGHGRGYVRYKGCPPPAVVPAPVVVERHSCGPAMAGFIGGLVVGAVLSHAAPPAPPPPAYVYDDPWCHERFYSLDAYYGHVRYHHHPRVAHVVVMPSGRWVDTCVWDDGRWYSRDRHADWDD